MMSIQPDFRHTTPFPALWGGQGRSQTCVGAYYGVVPPYMAYATGLPTYWALIVLMGHQDESSSSCSLQCMEPHIIGFSKLFVDKTKDHSVERAPAAFWDCPHISEPRSTTFSTKLTPSVDIEGQSSCILCRKGSFGCKRYLRYE